MASFYREVEIDIDVHDLMYGLSNSEIAEVIEYLEDEGLVIRTGQDSGGGQSLPEWEFDTTINKIAENRLRLTPEEDEVLKRIASRF